MFQFTTTNVVNSPYFGGYVPSDDASQEELEAHSFFTTGTDNEGNPTLYVKGVNNFIPENIIAIYKTPYRESKKAKLSVDFSAIEDFEDNREKTTKRGDVFRLNVYIGLTQGSNNAMYSNDSYFKGKPLMIDFSWDVDKATTIKSLIKAINQLGLTYEGEKMVNIIETEAGIEIEAVNEYQRFVKYAIEKLDPKAYRGMGDWEEVTNAITLEEEGQEGFGTYNWILHNLRIPTAARNDMFGQNFEETPVVGGQYDEYVIHYCRNRGSLGMNAVGHQVTSHTTHVFYLLKNCANDVSGAFEEVLISALGSVNLESPETWPDLEYVEDPKKRNTIIKVYPTEDSSASEDDESDKQE